MSHTDFKKALLATVPPLPVEKHPLMDRAFHTQDADRKTDWQGKVIADCGEGYFLVQLYEWIMGTPSTQHMFHLSEFAEKHPNGKPKFRFFETLEEANDYHSAGRS